jgi:hypothetical protein
MVEHNLNSNLEMEKFSDEKQDPITSNSNTCNFRFPIRKKHPFRIICKRRTMLFFDDERVASEKRLVECIPGICISSKATVPFRSLGGKQKRRT